MTTRIRLVQRHSDNLLLVHVVWATAKRAPVLAPSADSFLAEIFRRKAHQAGAALVACGNASDHVHVLVRYPSTVTVASVVQRLKGASSYEWNARQRGPHLSWQAGSWAASVSPSHLAPALRYVERQRLHHDGASRPEAWEVGALARPTFPGRDRNASSCDDVARLVHT
jgi:REP element-mobilizing transposase RayT